MKEIKELRSRKWFGREGKDGFIYRAWMKNNGIPDRDFGKPVIGICNTWSELTPCNSHFRELAEFVKKGIIEAGGFPVEFPVMSLGETLMKPTTMLFRNLVSMDVEESIRGNPIDGVVLLCGCDKTTPSLVMGAGSVDLPTIVVSGGPMLTGKYKGKNVATSDVWRFAAKYQSGEMQDQELRSVEGCMCRSQGHCAVMGTASSMACMVESLGLSLPGNAAIPAVDTHRKMLARNSGSRIVEMVKEDLKISDIVTKKAMENAIITNAAIGGSTNFIIHLLAIAGRLNIPLSLKDFDRLSREVPLIVNLQPSGKYYMEDFYYAGGAPVVLKRLDTLLHKEVITANGKTLRANYEHVECYNEEVISSLEQPFNTDSGLAVLKGNICEEGAVIKPSAASKKLMQHTGPAFVFENIEEYKEKINDEEIDIDENTVLVLKNVGPKGYPGMPEVGNMTLPGKLLKKGVKDMIRISDGRMSGTGFGTVVLHVSPEAAAGENFSVLQTGDLITLDVPNRILKVDLNEAELERRKQAKKQEKTPYNRGYVSMYIKHVLQASTGADLDFLRGKSGSEVLRDSH